MQLTNKTVQQLAEAGATITLAIGLVVFAFVLLVMVVIVFKLLSGYVVIQRTAIVQQEKLVSALDGVSDNQAKAIDAIMEKHSTAFGNLGNLLVATSTQHSEARLAELQHLRNFIEGQHNHSQLHVSEQIGTLASEVNKILNRLTAIDAATATYSVYLQKHFDRETRLMDELVNISTVVTFLEKQILATFKETLDHLIAEKNSKENDNESFESQPVSFVDDFGNLILSS